MKEQEQLQAIHDRLIKHYDDMNTGLFVPSSTIEDIADIIEKNQILSPLPHQDGASEIKHQLEYNIHSCKVSWCPICKEHFYTEDHYHVVSNQDGASAEDVVKATIMGYVDPNKVAKISGELMRVFKSETAKVVAEKDREIAGQSEVISTMYSQIVDATRQIAHLEQGMANWVRVSNERQEELNEAERRIKELEETWTGKENGLPKPDYYKPK